MTGPVEFTVLRDDSGAFSAICEACGATPDRRKQPVAGLRALRFLTVHECRPGDDPVGNVEGGGAR
jgi:hypothetical protein